MNYTVTIFDLVNNDLISKYKEIGYNYCGYEYINLFRWLWNEKNVHPVILCFPNDPLNRAMVRIHNFITNEQDVKYCNNYDECVVYAVEQVIKSPESYIK